MLTGRHSILTLKMSADIEEDADGVAMFCASCGIVGGDDDNKLKNCTGCYLVRYCSVKCQRDHRSKHKRECKKRAAELRDEILFKQPESNHHGDCPICCLPMPNDSEKSTLMSCCSKYICSGCYRANKEREYEGRLEHKCALCRKAAAGTYEEQIERLMKRIEANDPVAICHFGTKRDVEGDYKSAFEYWAKAAALGDARANYGLSVMYRKGKSVEKDEKKELHHLTEAAIAGHPDARHNLGCLEERRGRMDRAVKHWIIAAKLGHDNSLECVKGLYKDGYVSKEDFATALRGHHAAIEATKSPQREEAAEKLRSGSRSVKGEGSNIGSILTAHI